MVRFMLLSVVWLGLAGHSEAAKNTLLDEQLCQHYYTGAGDCGALRVAIRSEVRGTGVPTLELGDPSKPAMVFFHGWPDTAAIWANQFEKFCLGESAPFFCVAPSWIDFHPDFPRANLSELFWDVQRDRFHSVVEDLALTDVTFVIFDFGAVIGYQYVWEHPDVVKRVIAMDIGSDTKPPQPLPPNDGLFPYLMKYQQNNIRAFKSDDDAAMSRNLETELRGKSPCNSCRIAPDATGVGARTGWPYYQIIRSAKGEQWMDRLAPQIPLEDWQFYWAPSFPKHAPLLFLYSSDMFSSTSFRDWVNGRGDGSKAIKMTGTDHWLQVRVSNATNAEMERWLFPGSRDVVV
eukprot:TRINITY_DN5765_c0_g2_i1.p1 TRINITY_DN5765_c0_g2~~TRINITY_DN5765_c0_g2_i1.p1  ORF type:complete len:347 (+),score=52.54 TRINITY_DN5765_c0_g2_i1:62-1102(+)